MGVAEILATAVAIGADCFSVCVGLGMEPASLRKYIGITLLFGASQASLALTGYYVAALIHWALHLLGGSHAHWLARDFSQIHASLHLILTFAGGGILLLVGLGLILSHFRQGETKTIRIYRGRRSVVLLALMVNADALSAGLGLGMINGVAVPFVAILMFLVGGCVSGMGLEAGRRMGGRIGKLSRLVGGVLVVAVALKALGTAAVG